MDNKTNITYEFVTGEVCTYTVEELNRLDGMNADIATEVIGMEVSLAKNNRRETRRHLPLDNSKFPVETHLLHIPQSLEEQFIQEEKYQLLHKAIDSCLTEPQKRRVILYYFEGMTYEKIAEIDGVKLQSVSESILLALKKIKKFLY